MMLDKAGARDISPKNGSYILDLFVVMFGFAVCLAIYQKWTAECVVASSILGLIASIAGSFRISKPSICLRSLPVRAVQNILGRAIAALQVAFATTITSSVILLVVLMAGMLGPRPSFTIVWLTVAVLNLFSHAIGFAFPFTGRALIKFNRLVAHIVLGRT